MEMKDATSNRIYIRAREWKEVTGMSHAQTYVYLSGGVIRGIQVGKQWFIEAAELTEFFERNGKRAKVAA